MFAKRVDLPVEPQPSSDIYASKNKMTKFVKRLEAHAYANDPMTISKLDKLRVIRDEMKTVEWTMKAFENL